MQPPSASPNTAIHLPRCIQGLHSPDWSTQRETSRSASLQHAVPAAAVFPGTTIHPPDWHRQPSRLPPHHLFRMHPGSRLWKSTRFHLCFHHPLLRRIAYGRIQQPPCTTTRAYGHLIIGFLFSFFFFCFERRHRYQVLRHFRHIWDIERDGFYCTTTSIGFLAPASHDTTSPTNPRKEAEFYEDDGIFLL